MKPAPRRSAYDGATKLSARRRAIKAAWRATGLDDGAYRAMLQSVAGVKSSTELDLAGADKVLNHLNRQNGRAAEHPGKPGRVRPECVELIGKIEALLASMRLPWKYGLTILRHNGADAWAFASAEQLRSVITALVKEQQKRDMAQAVEASLEAIGRTREAGVAIARALGSLRPETWPRDVALMERMLGHLRNVASAMHAGAV